MAINTVEDVFQKVNEDNARDAERWREFCYHLESGAFDFNTGDDAKAALKDFVNREGRFAA